jgi:phospholipase/carboxylesterase
MQIIEKEFSGLKYSVVGPVGKQSPTVVLLHGYGANGRDLIPLSTYGGFAATHSVRWIFIQAPKPIPISAFEQGWAWFDLNIESLIRWSQTQDIRALAQWQPQGVEAIRDKVIGLIKNECDNDTQLIIGGFSQGAMLSLEIAFSMPGKLAGLVLLSGTWVNENVWKAKVGAAGLPRVFQSHGRMDPVLPFQAAERLHAELQAGGVTVEFHPFMGGHEIPVAVLNELHRFLERAFP